MQHIKGHYYRAITSPSAWCGRALNQLDVAVQGAVTPSSVFDLLVDLLERAIFSLGGFHTGPFSHSQ